MACMALTRAAARLIVKEHDRYAFSGPVLCLGVPDIYLSESELGAGSQESGPTESHGFVSPTAFFGALGLSDITSLDIPGSTHRPDLIHDLNDPIPPALMERFGLVVDPGTTEHVFDTRAGLINVANALRTDGVIIHFVPIYSFNGGYFSINPSVLIDFYSLNGFSDITAYIIMWDRYRPFADKSRCYRYTPALEVRHGLADRDQCRFTPHLLFFARKAEVVEEYRSPIQHDALQLAPSRPNILPKLIARALLPDPLITFFAAKWRRDRQLRVARADSFWI